jgi:AcrR family transcriptional regulator
MPAKKVISKQKILTGALAFIGERGEKNLNAPALAAYLGCSTQPLYAAFKDVGELKAAVKKSAFEHYETFMTDFIKNGDYPEYKAFGMGYIQYARINPKLFSYLFLCDRQGDYTVNDPNFALAVEAVKKSLALTFEKAERFQCQMWAYVHGIATMLATGYLLLEEKQISEMLTEMYRGLKAEYCK